MYHHLNTRIIPQPQQKSEDSLPLLAVHSLELDGKLSWAKTLRVGYIASKH